jgi:glycosyltransferase involved in cell wall biosynthesis
MHIAIDLTPMRPAGENGGAKFFVLVLLRQLQILAPHWRFLLLTAARNHAELAAYEASNMQRLLVAPEAQAVNMRAIVTKIGSKIAAKLKIGQPSVHPLAGQAIDLLFCPFSAPTYAQPHIPTVGIVYDLQHIAYPQFFSLEECQHRTRFLTELCQTAQKIICISDFSRRSLQQHFLTSAEQLTVIPITMHDRWQTASSPRPNGLLSRWELADRPYAFYPANYWPHKNHHWLLEVYGQYRQRCPDCALDLVFTGSLEPAASQLQEAIASLNLQPYVHCLGFVDEATLAQLWIGCDCLIFPSLYEGFGLPLLEAMAFGKPVLSSQAGSLPEVGGTAALYFDPTQPEELLAHWVALTQQPTLAAELVQKGRQNLQQLGDSMTMTQAYLTIFTTVIQQWQRQNAV